MKKSTCAYIDTFLWSIKQDMHAIKYLHIFLIVFLAVQSNWLKAENVLNLSPSPDDACALYIGAEEVYNAQGVLQGNFGSFAYFNSPSKLHFFVKDPQSEVVLFAFSQPTTLRSFAGAYVEDVRFRVVDPTGNQINCWGPHDKTGNIPGIPAGWQNIDAVNANLMPGSEGYAQVELGANVGYTPFVLDFSQLDCASLVPGEYTIEFYKTDYDSTTGFYVENWDISVMDNGGNRIAGRVWSNNWAIGIKQDDLGDIDPDFGRAFNGAFYACDNDNYVTKVDFNTGNPYEGFRGGTFNVFFNSSGVSSTGNILEDRKSIEDDITQDPNLRFEYRVFLEEPDVAVWPVPTTGDFLLMNPFLSRCDADEYCFNVSTDGLGEVQVLIDVNGNGIYNEAGELFLAETVEEEDLADANGVYPYQICIPWDGRDAEGNVIETTSLSVQIYFRQGVFHYPVHDVEYSDVGYRIESIRPCLCNACGDGACPIEVYFDDSNISVDNVLGPQVDLDGCSPLCHPWSAGTSAAFGNRNTINTWWYAFSQNEMAFIDTELEYLACTVAGPEDICFGEAATLTADCISLPANIPATQPVEYLWEGPQGFTSSASVVEVTEGGNYILTILNPATGCSYTDNLLLTVLPPDECCDIIGSLPPSDGGTYGDISDIPTPNEDDFSGLYVCFSDVEFQVTDTDGGGAGCVGDPLVITRDWTIIGDDGDPATPEEIITFQQTFEIVDALNPEFTTFFGFVTANCEDSLDPDGNINFQLLPPDVSDNVSANENLTLSYIDSEIVLGCNTKYVYRTWTVTDECGNSFSELQVIFVQDLTPPTVTCPADLVLGCGDALPAAYASQDEFVAAGGVPEDNCTTTFTISLQSETQIAGAETPECTLDDVWERTYACDDGCGNVVYCTQGITYEAPICDDGVECTVDSYDCNTCSCINDDAACQEQNTYCTFTIGYWGNHMDHLALVLNGEDLIIGDYTFTLECLNYVLPGPPKHTRNATYCGVAYEDNTSMLRQAIALKLNQMASPDFQESNNDVGSIGDLLLEDIYMCTENNPLTYYYETYPGITVSGLLTLGEEAAAAGINDTNLTEAMDAINIRFDECQENIECLEFRNRADELQDLNTFNVFPNPTNNFIHIDLNNYVGKKGTLQIVNHLGQVIETTKFDAIPQEIIRKNVTGYKHGIYMTVLQLEAGKPKVKHFIVENEF